MLQEGVVDVDEILAQPAESLAFQLLEQLRELEQALASDKPPKLPMLKLAEIFICASIGKQQELIAHLTRGYVGMDLGQRSEMTRTTLRICSVFGDPSNHENLEKTPENDRVPTSELNLEDKLGVHLQHHPVFVMSLLKVFQTETPQLVQKASQNIDFSVLAMTGARTFVECGVLKSILVFLQVVTALDKGDRQLLIENISSETGPATGRVLDKVIGVGCGDDGLIDYATAFLTIVTRRGFFLCLLPILELGLSIALHHKVMSGWLCFDSLLWLVALLAGYIFWKAVHECLLHSLEDFSKGKKDEAHESSMSADTRKWVIISIVAFCVALLVSIVGLISALVVVVVLLIRLFSSTSSVLDAICLAFVSLRLGVTALLCYILALTLREVIPQMEDNEKQKEPSDYGTMHRV